MTGGRGHAVAASTVVAEVVREVVDLIRGRFIPGPAFTQDRFIPGPAFIRDRFNTELLHLRKFQIERPSSAASPALRALSGRPTCRLIRNAFISAQHLAGEGIQRMHLPTHNAGYRHIGIRVGDYFLSGKRLDANAGTPASALMYLNRLTMNFPYGLCNTAHWGSVAARKNRGPITQHYEPVRISLSILPVF